MAGVIENIRWFEFQEFVRKSTLLEKEHIEENSI